MGKIYKNRLKLLLMCLTTVILSIFILASLSGASEISENAIKMPIIMYHSVLKDKSSQNDYVISPDLFESDLKYFQENGYTTVICFSVVKKIQRKSCNFTRCKVQ